MSLLKRNVVANLIGKGWSAILSIVVIPVYIHFMGIESYGLIGFFVTLLALFSILDIGISQTINREMARLIALPEKAQEIRNLVRTLEILNWIIAVSIGVLIFFLARPIALYWIQSERSDYQTVYYVLILMGLSITFQWPSTFYSGAMIGLQKQVLLNVVLAVMTTLRCVGSVLILWLVSPSIETFFMWQVIIYAFQAMIMAFVLWSNLPKTGNGAVFQPSLLNNIWRFAAGMGGIAVISLVISQADKFILSKLLTLEAFGYYSLAVVAATSFSFLMGPLVTAIYPRFTQLVAAKDRQTLKQIYHSGCQFMTVLIIPIALFIAFFAKEIILIWTQNPITVKNIHLLVTFLAISTMFNGLAHIPLSLQYAHGRTRLIFYISVGMVIIMIPGIFLMTHYFGAVGATVILMAINLLYMITITRLVHGNIFPEENRRWYVNDVGLPLLAALISAGIGRIIVHGTIAIVPLAFKLAAVGFIILSVTSFATPIVRGWLLNRIVSFSRKYSYGI